MLPNLLWRWNESKNVVAARRTAVPDLDDVVIVGAVDADVDQAVTGSPLVEPGGRVRQIDTDNSTQL